MTNFNHAKQQQVRQAIKKLSTPALESLKESLQNDPEMIFEGLRDNHLQKAEVAEWTSKLGKIFTDDHIRYYPDQIVNIVEQQLSS